jgi:hypothetical protein
MGLMIVAMVLPTAVYAGGPADSVGTYKKGGETWYYYTYKNSATINALLKTDGKASVPKTIKGKKVEYIFSNNEKKKSYGTDRIAKVKTIDFSKAVYLKAVSLTQPPAGVGNKGRIKVEAMDFSQNKKLLWINFQEVSIGTLDLSKNSKLTNISLNKCTINTLKVSGMNNKNYSLFLSGSSIKNIFLTSNKTITEIAFTEIKIGVKPAALRTLSITDYSKLETLEIDQCKNLTSLTVVNTDVESFTLPKSEALAYLDLRGNPADTVEIGASPVLYTLNADGTYTLNNVFVDAGDSVTVNGVKVN